VEIKNKKAYFDYFIEETYESGIELKGTEIKAIRNGSVDIKDSYVKFKDNEAFVINSFIDRYEEGNQFNHEERRSRKLLLHKKEILKLQDQVAKEGYNVVPLKMYFKKNKVKLLIGLAKGKKLYDKRESIKERDLKKENRYS